jgi:hypothetical protein
MSRRLNVDLRLDRSMSFPMIFRKLVLQNQPVDMELSIIKRAQLLGFKQPANMSTHGEMMDAMYLRRLFDAQKCKSSEISKRQANPLSK